MAFAYSWSLVIGHTVTGNLLLVSGKLAQKLNLKTAHPTRFGVSPPRD